MVEGRSGPGLCVLISTSSLIVMAKTATTSFVREDLLQGLESLWQPNELCCNIQIAALVIEFAKVMA